MKTTFLLLGLYLLSAAAAHGQSMYGGGATLSNQPQMFEFQSHTLRAAQKPMEQSENLLGDSGFVYGQGERPLWEFSSPTKVVPLGDTARMLKKEHTIQKKADIVWQN
jgi:hypothetical protein